MLTILTWHFTRVYTTKSLDNLASGLRFELLQRPLLRMWNIVNSTVEVTTAQVNLSEYIIKKFSTLPVTQENQVEVGAPLLVSSFWFYDFESHVI